MNPRLLVHMAVIAELGSVSKAARKLNLTQPTLSRSIRMIEEEVGGPVLRRGRHGVSATDIGSRLALEGEKILTSMKAAKIMVREWQTGLNEPLRIGVGPMLAATLMADFFAERIQDPTLNQMKIHCEYASGLVEKLKTNMLDLAVIPSELDKVAPGLDRVSLFEDRLSVFVGTGDPLADQVAVHPQALADHNWIIVGDDSGLFESSRDILERMGLLHVVPRVIDTGDVTMIFKMLTRGNGCTILPLRQLERYQQDFGVTPLDLSFELPKRNIAAWTSSRATDNPEVQNFLRDLQSFMATSGLS